MTRGITVLIILTCSSLGHLHGQDIVGPDTVFVQSGTLTLSALLWYPPGPGRFPALIFSHGNYASNSSPGTIDSLLGPVTSTSLLGPVFAGNGYVFLALFRRGVGLSKGQGESSQDLLVRTLKETSLEERNRLQMRLLETEQLEDMISGVQFLRRRQNVDTNRVVENGAR